jgi:DNA modification methylase
VTDNLLYYGDNLDVLRRHVKDESVDLVYLDPPFNSNATYGVLFSEQDGTRSAAQIKAFGDTWRWDQSAAAAYAQIVEGGGRVADALRAFRTFLGDSDMLAYLAMMAPRLVELRRVLKPTGSIYLHCDPTASHYLKLILDATFGPDRFLSEVIWKRQSAHSSAKRYGPVHDVILVFTKGTEYIWVPQFQPHGDAYLASHYGQSDEQGAFTLSDLTAAGVRHGSSGEKWHGFDPASKGNHWKFTIENLDKLNAEGRIYWPKKEGGWPRYRRYLSSVKGVPLQDVWTDIFPVNAKAAERLGYPTQKPVALLERIIAASSDEGFVVLDPFCGCGTTIDAAQKLGRHWIGIDITHLAIGLIKHRLQTAFGAEAKYRVIGEPTDVAGAAELAESDPYQFQWWALGLCGARPAEQKKGADKGIDGRLFFHDAGAGGETKQIIFSVKAGKVQSPYVRDLVGVLDREKAQIGVLLSLNPPTKDMRSEAASAGFYASPWGERYPRVQLLTVEELLGGAKVNYPPSQANVTLKAAPKVKAAPLPKPKLPFYPVVQAPEASAVAEDGAEYDADHEDDG